MWQEGRCQVYRAEAGPASGNATLVFIYSCVCFLFLSTAAQFRITFAFFFPARRIPLHNPLPPTYRCPTLHPGPRNIRLIAGPPAILKRLTRDSSLSVGSRAASAGFWKLRKPTSPPSRLNRMPTPCSGGCWPREALTCRKRNYRTQ